MALKYIGPLFVQIGRRHIPLEMHSDDVDKMEIELSSLRSALAVAQSRVSECSDREALLADNIELRSALAEKTKEVERLREALRRIEYIGTYSTMPGRSLTGTVINSVIKLTTEARIAREALAATELGKEE